MKSDDSSFRFFGETYRNNNKKEISRKDFDNGKDYDINKIKKSNLVYESKFNGSLIIVDGIHGKIEFYPGGGAFVCKSTGYRGKYVDNLINYAKFGKKSF
jgi:hypothetical protein